jgi:hypothetical protein
VHLDLHGALAEVHEQAAHEHRREAVHHRHVARIAERHVGERRPRHYRQGERDRQQRIRFVEVRDQSEDRHVERKEGEAYAIHSRQVLSFEDAHLPRQNQILEELFHYVSECSRGPRFDS